MSNEPEVVLEAVEIDPIEAVKKRVACRLELERMRQDQAERESTRVSRQKDLEILCTFVATFTPKVNERCGAGEVGAETHDPWEGEEELRAAQRRALLKAFAAIGRAADAMFHGG